MPCLSWRGRTAQHRDGQLYDLLSMWYQCAALFHGKRIPHVFQVFSSLFYALRKIRNLLILIPVVIVRYKFVNPITLFLKSLFQQGYLWHFWFLGSLILIYLVMPLLYWLLHDHTLALSLLCMLLALCSICLCLLSMHRGYSIQQYVPQTLRLWTWLFFFLFGGLCAVKAEKNSLFLSIHMPLWLHWILVLLLAILNNFCIPFCLQESRLSIRLPAHSPLLHCGSSLPYSPVPSPL